MTADWLHYLVMALVAIIGWFIRRELINIGHDLRELKTAAAGFTPLAQHQQAYDKVHSRIDSLNNEVIRLQERLKVAK